MILEGIRMEDNKVQVSLEELLYYILFAVILFTKGVGLDEGSLLFRGCLMLGVLLLACKFLVGQYSMAEIIIAGVLGIWGAFTFKVTGSLGMFIYVVLAIGMKNVSVKRIFVVGTTVWSICMFYSVTAAVFWGRTGVRRVDEKFGMGPVLRESLGYTHPNVLHITYVLLMVFALYLCINHKKKIFYTVCLLLLGNLYVFMYSFSSTGVLTSAVLFILFFYFYKRRKFSLWETGIIQGLPIVCVIISIVFPMALGNGILFEIVNKIFNSRLWAIKVFFALYDISLFGGGNEGIDFSLDNSYVYAINEYGVIPFIMLTAAYVLLLRYCIKKNLRMELAVICTFLFAGISEPFLFNASIKNITFIFLGEFLYRVIENEKCVFKLLSRYNKCFLFSCDFGIKLKKRLSSTRWKMVAGVALTAGILSFLLLFPKDVIGINQVYVDEKLCDAARDTVRLTEFPAVDGTMYIENASKDINYYYFTHENSQLIELMDLRFKISLSVYIAVAVGILYMCGRKTFNQKFRTEK
ncbi:hypothetical protein D5281_01685 [bacterium 1xD42-62]|uniref:Uncharacterized protein n=2 Tax=Parablautia muri TaxID=2320879 RepID=A0A9X5BCU2_9FIRM|nr:hypothetical protein [Parablautia muri]